MAPQAEEPPGPQTLEETQTGPPWRLWSEQDPADPLILDHELLES